MFNKIRFPKIQRDIEFLVLIIRFIALFGIAIPEWLLSDENYTQMGKFILLNKIFFIARPYVTEQLERIKPKRVAIQFYFPLKICFKLIENLCQLFVLR